ncbi:MAG: peptidoglycan DD-metalloendopeptidase family protein [Ruminococcus sp.]|nr:peptidoglycan DD-metalloendopeptidase family protein [Ruminococcus sp.]
MSKLSIVKKILSFIVCISVSAGIVCAYPVFSDKDVMAKTVLELQEQRKSNEEKIKELESQLTQLEGNKKKEKEFQESLYEQISLIQDNINLLNAELNKISADISSASENIYLLDTDIKSQEVKIDEELEIFKDRLCKIYMSSNENIASVILGSASFYDMMSRVQMMNRMSEYDEDLITGITEQIEKLEQSKKDLESERVSLQLKMEEQERKISEKADEINALNAKMVKTTDELNRLAMEQERIKLDKEKLDKNNQSLKEEEEKLAAALLAQQQENEKRIAEEAKKKAAAAAEKAAEEAKKAQEKIAAAQNAESAKNAYEKATAKASSEVKASESAALKKAQEEAEKAAAAAKAAQEAKEKAEAERYAKEAEEARRQAEEAARLAEEAARQAEYQEQQRQQEEQQRQQEEQQRQQEEQQRQQEEQYNNYYDPSSFIWPVPGYSYITSGVGPRWGTNHNGIDIGDAGIYGAAVVASRSGIVIYGQNTCSHDYGKSDSCGCGGGYGNYVFIDHGDSYSTLYGHLSQAVVHDGEYVEQGQVIGYVGTTGWSTGPHLHFEIRLNNIYQDPEQYVSP